MDYFQGVVAEYLQADRGMFVNPEILLQLDVGKIPRKGRYWYCDLMAVSLKERAVYLCEVTYAENVAALARRLSAWQVHWPELCASIGRDCGVDPSWRVRPWVFIPESRRIVYDQRLSAFEFGNTAGMPKPTVTALEDVLPWKYCAWDRSAANVVG